jgi:hypothetical protein
MKINEVADGLSEMEIPFYEVRNLAMAARMMASADAMPKDAGAALDAVADLAEGKGAGFGRRLDYPTAGMC